MDNLEQLHQKLYDEAITFPEEQEEQIINTSTSVANTLYTSVSQKAYAEFYEHRYIFAVNRRIVNYKDTIMMSILDEGGEKKKLYTVNSEIDNNLSYLECLRATVAAFLRDQLGLLRPEVLEEE